MQISHGRWLGFPTKLQHRLELQERRLLLHAGGAGAGHGRRLLHGEQTDSTRYISTVLHCVLHFISSHEL